MGSKLGKKLLYGGLLSLVLACGSRELYQTISDPENNPLRASSHHLKPFLQAAESAKKNFPQGLTPAQMLDQNGPLFKMSPEETIPACGYKPFSANVNSLQEAKFILIGDRHTTNNYIPLLKRLADKNDLLLVEESCDSSTGELLNTGEDARLIKKEIDLQHKQVLNQLPYSFDLSSRSALEEREQSLKEHAAKLQAAISYLESIAPEVLDTNSYHYYARFQLGMGLRCIDARKADFNKHLISITDSIVPKCAALALMSNIPLHPFDQWYAYQDRKITSPKKPVTNQVSDLSKVFEDNEKEAARVRQSQIASNLLEVVEKNKNAPSSKTFVFFGSQHFESEAHGELALPRVLEKKGVPYVAFVADFPSPQMTNNQGVIGPISTDALTYIETFLVPRYIELRSDAGPPFTNSLSGFADYLNNVMCIATEKNFLLEKSHK